MGENSVKYEKTIPAQQSVPVLIREGHKDDK